MLLYTWTLVGLFFFATNVYLWNYALFCGWSLGDSTTRILLIADPQIEGSSRTLREPYLPKHFSVFYSDYYIRHVVSSLFKTLNPTHVVVLGDLLSSQYIDDEEFRWRATRFYWIFDSVTSAGIQLINIVGNHDVGYGSEVSPYLISRFEKYFGQVNQYFETDGHILANINSINLDQSKDKALQNITLQYLNGIINLPKPVILFTHIPMHKPAGNCVDGPQIITDYEGNIVQQNFLSENITDFILQKIHPTYIFTGHDHEGCDYIHPNGIPEHTVRSVMGDYSGNAGLFEIAKIPKIDKKGNFKYHFGTCKFVRLQILTVLAILVVLWGLCPLLYVGFMFLKGLFQKWRKSGKME